MSATSRRGRWWGVSRSAVHADRAQRQDVAVNLLRWTSARSIKDAATDPARTWAVD